eukprot:27691_4
MGSLIAHLEDPQLCNYTIAHADAADVHRIGTHVDTRSDTWRQKHPSVKGVSS